MIRKNVKITHTTMTRGNPSTTHITMTRENPATTHTTWTRENPATTHTMITRKNPATTRTTMTRKNPSKTCHLFSVSLAGPQLQDLLEAQPVDLGEVLTALPALLQARRDPVHVTRLPLPVRWGHVPAQGVLDREAELI